MFEKEDTFLAQRGLTMQTVNPNATSLNSQLHNTWYKTITPNENHMLCIDAPGGNAFNGNMLWLWECNGMDSQIWVFDNFQIRYGLDESFCIDAREMQNGEQLMMWECNGLGQQTWGWDADELKVYIANTAVCLDSYSGDTDNGQNLHVWDCNGLANQQWGLWDSGAPSGAGPSPPGPPGPPCQAVGNWPKFTSYDQLNADNWGRYFEAVYGEVPDSGYPICLSDFWIVYPQELTKANVQVPTAQTCPRDGSANSKGDLYSVSQRDDLGPPNTKAIFQPPPLVAFESNSWIEIVHSAFPSDEHFGCWMYMVKGSGIWYNTGKTTTFNDHADAFKHYGVATTGGPGNEAMSKACVAAGDTTIQFLKHMDGGTCGKCCHNQGGGAVWNYEFVGCAMSGVTACPGNGGAIKAGWMGKRDCQCVEGANGKTVNCKGVPMR